MGFLSDIFKSDIAKMFLPMALSAAMPGIGAFLGKSSFLGGMNPMMRSALEQSLLGYGTAKLTGSKHPEKAAMYAGLGSLPFSYLKANQAANAFNKEYAGAADLYKTKGTPIMTDPGKASWWDYQGAGPGGLEQQLGIGSAGSSATYHPAIAPTYTPGAPWSVPKGFTAPEKLTAWDVLKGKEYKIPEMRNLDSKTLVHMTDPQGEIMFNKETGAPLWEYQTPWETSGATIPAQEGITPEFDFYSKVGKGGKNLLGQTLEEGETYTDWLPTIASQTAGWYGGRPTDEELWEDSKSRRRKELAFMYGIPEELMGGELENPYYTGGGFWKDGGIATLEMDAGGAVNGPGGPKDDVIDAKLSDGEFVMTAKAVENFGGGDRMAGAKRMYNMMNQLDPESETVQESVIGV